MHKNYNYNKNKNKYKINEFNCIDIKIILTDDKENDDGYFNLKKTIEGVLINQKNLQKIKEPIRFLEKLNLIKNSNACTPYDSGNKSVKNNKNSYNKYNFFKYQEKNHNIVDINNITSTSMTTTTSSTTPIDKPNNNTSKYRLQKGDKEDYDFTSHNINIKPIIIYDINKNDFNNEVYFEDEITKIVGNQFKYEYYNNLICLYVSKTTNKDDLMNNRLLFPSKKKRNTQHDYPSLVICNLPNDLDNEVHDILKNNDIVKILNDPNRSNRNKRSNNKRYKPSEITLKVECKDEITKVRLLKDGINIKGITYKTEPNIKSFKQCQKCKSFGHLDHNCEIRLCANCGSDRHPICNNKDRLYCINCNSTSHNSYSKKCEKYADYFNELLLKEWKNTIICFKDEILNIKDKCHQVIQLENFIDDKEEHVKDAIDKINEKKKKLN
jgi:hypothetical protein